MITPSNRPEAKEGARSIWPPLVVCVLVALLLCSGVVVLFLLPRPSASGGPATRTQNEIGQLNIAVENFKTFFKLRYIPSQIRLAEIYSDYQLVEKRRPCR